MTRGISFIFIVLISTVLFSCKKDNTADNSFYIEATINGVNWRGESTGDYYAVNSTDNSIMKIFLDTNFLSVSGFNFLSNTTLQGYALPNANFSLENFVVGTFDSKVSLKWETSFETNIKYFEVQRATVDGAHYLRLAQISAAGTSTSINHYSYTITGNSLSGNSEYLNTLKFRLEVVHADGSSVYTNPIPVNYIVSKVQIAYGKVNGPVYFGLDNNQNQMTITSYNQTTKEAGGTFAFNYKDDAGRIVKVTNGKFHLKQ